MNLINAIREIIKVGTFLYKHREDERIKEIRKDLENIYKDIKGKR